jgi:hypothetical protein
VIDRLVSTGRVYFWALLLLLLPVTSMPLVKTLVRSSTVASPSILPLAALVLVWLLPFIAGRGKLPGQSRPLFGFLCVAVLSCCAAVFLSIPTFKNIPVLSEELKALITLLIGLGYYLVTSTWVSTQDRFQMSLRWINYGGLLVIIWSMFQAVAWFGFHRYPDWMRNFQDLLSLGPLYRQRVAGFALEPSWFAHQMNMLYLPLWLAATVRRTTSHRFSLLGLTLENLLLVGGIGCLVLSFSRVGLLAFCAVLTYLFLRLNLWLVGKLRAWLVAHFRWSTSRRILLSAGVGSVLLFFYVGGLVGGLWVYSRVYPPMASVFKIDFWKSSGFLVYANKLQFGERAAYWQAGWNIFNDHPWLGVGLGNAGYLFQEQLPAYAWQMTEVRTLMYRTDALPNTKNLWTRLLSETGILGFAFFVTWLYLMFQSARMLQRSPQPLLQMSGLVGIFVLIGILFEGFSIDSFAMPYYWISFGLVTASFRMLKNRSETESSAR